MTADEIVAFAEELARVAAAGGGPKALAGVLARVTGCGVLVEDAQWRHVTAAGSGLPSSVRGLAPEPSGNVPEPLRGGRAGRSMAIAGGETRFGQISIFGSGDLDCYSPLLRLTAGAIAVELARDPGGHPARRRAFWERLSAGAYADAASARDDAAARGIVPATHYLAVAVEPEASDERAGVDDRNAVRARALQVFRAPDAETAALEIGNTTILLVPAAREIDTANARTAAALFPRTVAKTLPHVRAAVGVGTRAALADVPVSIARAQSALAIARRLYGAGKAGIYEELGAYPLLLEGAGSTALREFAARTLAPLRSYDEKHQTELERTLRLYFDVGENVKTAAAQLHVHRHTVFYRLRQIGEICGCKLGDPHDQLTLRMAMAIDALTPQ
ncbi:MAG TPA: helix-turn-helix domain-containing protein [Candidatus Baltobacteraceae bacterium]|nr:helix-turn-helix domain-containing protein [Candidatus Baltobacteraceae bacterium]